MTRHNGAMTMPGAAHNTPLRRPRRHSRYLGFTLIEVLVALLVISLGLFGFAALQAKASQFNQGSYLRSQANSLGYDIVDRMRANRDMALAGGYDVNIAVNGSAPAVGGLAQSDLQQWWASVDDALPAASAEISVATDGTATAAIEWQQQQADRDPSNVTGNERVRLTVETRL